MSAREWKHVPALRLCVGGHPVIEHVIHARSSLERFFGLMGRRGLPCGVAMWFPACRSIHTCWMRFKLDVAFVALDGTILKRTDALRPWRLAFGGAHAYGVLETQSGWLPVEAGEGAVLRRADMTGIHACLPCVSHSENC